MLEKKLQKLLNKANDKRQNEINSSNYYYEGFHELSKFIFKKLNSKFFKNKKAKLIASHFDEILPFIVSSNIDILLINTNLLIDQPTFKEKFMDGLKKYPYKDGINEIFYAMWVCLNENTDKYNDFFDTNVLKTLSTMDVNIHFYSDTLNRLNGEKQKEFLNLLVENKCDIPYLAIEYKGDNKQIIYNNIQLFTENAQNLYALMSFVKDDPEALSKVKNYIDINEEKAINSIFCETDKLAKIKDPTLKEIIKILILEIKQNENVKFSDITFNSGGFSRVLLIGDKVLKLGNRITKHFPNNPYIIAPLIREEFKFEKETCFMEITERVDTNVNPSQEELYQLYQNLRNLGLIWTDIKPANVGRLRKKNIIHWNENLDPSEETLGFDKRRSEKVLNAGDLVILDADFIYDENAQDINYTNQKEICNKFEERYQREKKEKEETKRNSNVFNETNNYETSEFKGISR